MAEIDRLYVEFYAGTVRGSFLFGEKSREAVKHVGVGIQVSLKLGQKDQIVGEMGSYQIVNIGIVDGIGGGVFCAFWLVYFLNF